MKHPLHYVAPEVRARLEDAEQVRNAYAVGTIKQAGHSLGAGQKAFVAALGMHGIARRKRGEKAPGLVCGLTRDDVRRAAYAAYRRLDKCPPDCIGRATCLDPGGKCVLWELT